METIQMTEYINKFIVDFFRISERNGIAYTNKSRYVKKSLLQHCLYLERCIIFDINRTHEVWYDYEEMIKELDKFIESETINENSQTECCLAGWFPSHVEAESSFFTFAKIMWIEQHYLSLDEQKIFEEMILPCWVKSYFGNYEVSNIELQDRIRNLATTDKTLTDLQVRDWMIECFSGLVRRHYEDLYTGENDYLQRKDVIAILQEEFKECMFNLFKSAQETVNEDGEEAK